MEFRPQDVARLVLGYLKDHKFEIAYTDLLNNCQHLKHLISKTRKKSVVTRVFGLSLIDYLSEYEIIYNIIQERLENTDYFKENGARTSLVTQLQYLLNSPSNLESRTSTPIHTDNRIKKLNARKEVDNLQRLDVLGSSSDKNSSIENVNESSQEQFEEILTQTFLDKPDLIERLASNINKEVSTNAISDVDNVLNFNLGHELDKNKINTIVERIEADPAIVQLFDEILNQNPDDGLEMQQDCFREFTQGIQSVTPRKAEKSEESARKRPQSNKKKFSNSLKNSSIEDQNDDAIQSIVAVATHSDDVSTNPESKSVVQMDEIVINNTYENTVNTSALITQSNANQMYVNTGGCFVMLPSNMSSAPTLISNSNIQLDSTKPYYFIGQQQIFNTKTGQTPIKLANQDFLNVPTLIMCDTRQTTTTSSIVMPTTTSSIVMPTVPMQPRSTEKYQGINEYLTLYKASEPLSSTNVQPQLETTANPRVKSKIKRLLPKKRPPLTTSEEAVSATSKEPLVASKEPLVINRESLVITKESLGTNREPLGTNREPLVINREPLLSIPEANLLDVPKRDGNAMPTLATPTTNSENVRERKSRSTPRNGSHIRQLNFTTPEKWRSADRLAKKSSKNYKPLGNDTPVKPSKRNTSNCRRSSLFTSDKIEDESKPVDKPQVDEVESDTLVTKKESNEKESATTSTVISNTKKANSTTSSWDADLRALTGVQEPEVTEASKPKRKRLNKNRKTQKTKEKVLEEKSPNSTEEDALKFESALADIGTNIEDVEIIIPGLKEKSDNSKSIEDVKKEDTVAVKAKEESSDLKLEEAKEDSVILNELNVVREPVNVNDEIVNSNNDTPEEHQSLSVPLSVDTTDSYLTEDLFTRNIKAKLKIRKKCNMSNVAQTSQSSDEVILTHITKITSCENLTENHTLILSPSKLNANKRNLVQTPIETSSEKLITPELMTFSSNMPLLAAKRDISSLLETPFKSIMSSPCPKTPGTFSSPLINTPFTQAVIAQLQDVDINTIPTPKFPITPHFAVTPDIGSDKSPFRSRPTDYSTSSSYYHPSDTEQNKSIEQLIMESKRLESEGLVDQINVVGNSPKDVENKIESKPTPTAAELFVEKTKAFNSSIIGRKNLQLIQDVEDDSSSHSSFTSNSSSSSSTSSDESDTTIENSPIRPKRESHYGLRSKKKTPELLKKVNNSIFENLESGKSNQSLKRSSNETSKKEEVPKEDKKVKKAPVKEKLEKSINVNTKFEEPSSSNLKKTSERLSSSKKPTPEQKLKQPLSAKKLPSKNLEAVLKQKGLAVKKSTSLAPQLTELEEKRQRIIAKLKNMKPSTSVPKVAPKKVVKFSKRISNMKKSVTTPVAKPTVKRKPKSPQKPKEEPALLHLSSDESMTNKSFEIIDSDAVTSVAAASRDKSKSEIDPIDAEAQTLVNGLKEWGIHLIPNKSKKNVEQKPDESAQLSILAEAAQEAQNVRDSKVEEPEIKDKPAPADLEDLVQFDLKNLFEEPQVIYYDSKHAKRKPIKYNPDILNKTFSANVYISEIDAEAVVLLSMTPMDFLLDLPAKPSVQTDKKKASKTINLLSTHVIKQSSGKQLSGKTAKLAVKKSSDASEKPSAESKTLKSSILLCNEILPLEKATKKLAEEEDRSKKNTKLISKEPTRKSTDSKQVSKSKSKSEDSKLKNRTAVEQEVKKVKSLKGLEEKVDKGPEKVPEEVKDIPIVAEVQEDPGNINDDLMNYALIGSERIPNNEETPSCSDSKKRRRSNSQDKPVHKKKKDETCHELLKSIDVDSFLKQLHGDN